MGYINPYWISDYTFGGISMQMFKYYNTVNPGIPLLAIASVLAPQNGVAEIMQKQNNNCAIIEFNYSNDSKMIHLAMISNMIVQKPVEPLLGGEFILRAFGSDGEIFETTFDVHILHPRSSRLRRGIVEIPNPEKWVGFQIVQNGDIIYKENYGIQPMSVKLNMKFSKTTEITGENELMASKNVVDWGGVKPRLAMAMVRTKQNPDIWEPLPSFSLESPKIVIPKRILDQDNHPVVKIKVFFGLMEQVQTFIWGNENPSE
jgi:hypothetical protein